MNRDDSTPPLRLLVVLPSWVGDAVMATPALRLIRRSYPGAFIGALCRPGINELLAGTDFIDEFHVERVSGVMGPKFVAAKLRPRRYDTCLLLTNSFSTALTVRIAGIERRVGYDRDARGLLLTHPLAVPHTGMFKKAIIPAVTYYYRAAQSLLHCMPPAGDNQTSARVDPPDTRTPTLELPRGVCMELGTTPSEEQAATELLSRAGVATHDRFVVLNPGGNKEFKRWPAERFTELGVRLSRDHGYSILINGSPAEIDLCGRIATGVQSAHTGARVAQLPALGITLGSLKGVVKRASLMVTNDTGPRHIAAAFGVPLVSLFGPTDHRWTIIPTRPDSPEEVIVADPTLPEHELANDHPERCRIDRIELPRVVQACERVLRVRASAAV